MAGTKDVVLNFLEQNKGTFLSGETIAKELSLSRNSVWKAIESLRRDGYRIEAASRRGYSLSGESDILSSSGILSFLSFGMDPSQIHIFDSLESTNKTAKSMASLGASHGTVVISKTQTLGSGRKNRSFFSPEGGIYMSIILDPHFLPFSNTALITSYTAVCICKAMEKLANVTPTIKWINDIYLGSKKICGILTESGTDFESGEIQWLVVGIGINFAIDQKAFPVELRKKAGSLFTPGETIISKNHLIAEIIDRLTSPVSAKKLTPSSILRSYKKRLNMLDAEVTVIQRNGESYTAIAKDIDENGKLIIELPDKSTKTLSSEEISIRI